MRCHIIPLLEDSIYNFTPVQLYAKAFRYSRLYYLVWREKTTHISRIYNSSCEWFMIPWDVFVERLQFGRPNKNRKKKLWKIRWKNHQLPEDHFQSKTFNQRALKRKTQFVLCDSNIDWCQIKIKLKMEKFCVWKGQKKKLNSNFPYSYRVLPVNDIIEEEEKGNRCMEGIVFQIQNLLLANEFWMNKIKSVSALEIWELQVKAYR